MSSRERTEAMQEARLLAELKHPYIVAFRESWCEEGRLCIVMDYAENGDLQQRIVKQKRSGQYFAESQVVRWLTNAVLAIKHLHDRKILHRDIKSSNFFLTADGRIRIGDFGIAKELGATDAMARTAIGTPYYLAPEICKERPYSWSADMWSLGVVIYELCALRVPYDAPNIRALAQRIVSTEPARLPSAYSEELKNLILSLLQKDPNKRPSAAVLLGNGLIQNEIKIMLMEEQQKKLIAKQAAAMQQAANPTPVQPSSNPQVPSRRPSDASLQQYPVRSSSQQPGSRAPSPLPSQPSVPSQVPSRRPSDASLQQLPVRSSSQHRAPSPHPSQPPSSRPSFGGPQGGAVLPPNGYRQPSPGPVAVPRQSSSSSFHQPQQPMVRNNSSSNNPYAPRDPSVIGNGNAPSAAGGVRAPSPYSARGPSPYSARGMTPPVRQLSPTPYSREPTPGSAGMGARPSIGMRVAPPSSRNPAPVYRPSGVNAGYHNGANPARGY